MPPRRRRAGEPTRKSTGPNLAEEIEDVGRSELHKVADLLTQAILNDPEAEAWRPCAALAGHRAAVPAARAPSLHRSMRLRIDPADLYGDALAGLPDTLDGQAPLPCRQSAWLGSMNCFGSHSPSCVGVGGRSVHDQETVSVLNLLREELVIGA